MSEVQDVISDDAENTNDTQVKIQITNEVQGDVQHVIEETRVGSGKNMDETPLSVDINIVENTVFDSEQNNVIKTESVGNVVAEEDISNGALISPEFYVETKLEVDPDETKVIVEEVLENKSFEEVKETVKEEDGDVDVEEEYEEEELDENGEVKVVKKIITVKAVQNSSKKTKSVVSYVEEEEEYEEEEVDENGESKIVIRTRLVRIPKEKVQLDKTLSFEEVEEEFQEEEEDNNGEIITVTKTRLVKVPKSKVKSDDKLHVLGEDEGESNVSHLEKKSVEHEMIAEEKPEDADESVDEGDLGEELAEGREKKSVKTKKSKLERTEILGSKEEDEGTGTKEMEERESSTSLIEVEETNSQLSLESAKEGEEGAEQGSERSSVKSSVSSKVTISSEEQRIAAEKAEIAQKFDILLKLRGDHVFLRRKNFSLNNKLILYFKKQKMEYVFTETRDDQDLDNKFYQKLEVFFEHNNEIIEEKININTEWEAQKRLNEELSNTVKEANESLFEKKREIGSKMIDSRTGRTIQNDKAVDDVVSRQDLLMRQLSECSLTEIKLKRKIETKRRERQMKHMGNDFNLMDYEKLASLKEYYMDKITERDIEINEVSEKLAAMEENINLVKDRLKHTEGELEIERLRLQEVSTDLLRKRANLNQVKANRHRTEKNTAKIKQQSGLLAYPILLKDYEDKSQQTKELTTQLESLKQSHRNGIVKIRNLRDNIKKRTAMKFSAGISGKFSAMSTSLR